MNFIPALKGDIQTPAPFFHHPVKRIHQSLFRVGLCEIVVYMQSKGLYRKVRAVGQENNIGYILAFALDFQRRPQCQEHRACKYPAAQYPERRFCLFRPAYQTDWKSSERKEANPDALPHSPQRAFVPSQARFSDRRISCKASSRHLLVIY